MARRISSVLVLVFLSATAALAADPAKSILVLRADGAGIDDQTVIDSLEATLRNRWPSPVHVYVEDVDPGRFSPEAYRTKLPSYLRAKHRSRIDLLVVLSLPALEFVLPNRESLFRNVPILFAGAGQTPETLQAMGMTGVVVKCEPAQTAAIALQLQPNVTQIVLVAGAGRVDRTAAKQASRELTPLASRVTLTSWFGLPLSDLLGRLQSLPSGSIVLYIRMTKDATGATLESKEVLRLMRKASNVPIYGSSTSYLGDGLVGGALVDQRAIGNTLGVSASRILAGEPPLQIAPVLAPTVTAFDARELQRLGIDLKRLPRESVLEFRQPTLWERFWGHIPYVSGLVGGLSALLAALFAQWRERRRAQRALAELVRFEKNFADVSTSFITVRSDGIQGAVRNALRRLLEGADADRAVIYEASDSRTLHWKALFSESRPDLGTCETSRDWDADLVPSLTARLRAGHVVTLLDTSTREELLASAPETLAPAAAVVVPLIVGTDMLGVLWCIWLRQPTIKLRHDVVVERFRLIGELLANALRRSQIEAKLAETTDLNAAILQSLTLNVAVLDRTGTIIAVNDAWVKFGRQNGVSPESAILPGANYVEPVRKAADEGVPDAREALQGVRDVCERRRDLFTLEYECSSPGHQRWFVMTVAALRWHGGGAVVTHRDITESKQIEIATRESESRFRLLADALPVGVWMSDSESRRIYFNRTWVEYTGQSIGWQLGDGWTHTLHPDDRQRYLDVYRAAFEAREPFSIEYRIRRHSGGYGWFLDTAVPRYGDDGSFRGYVGGCLDVTERKEVEDALRDLAGRVISAEEEDRRRVARELHDGVSQLVALLAIEIEQTGQTPIRTQEDLTARTHALWERTAEISRELHRQAHALHPSRLETFGLVAALEGYCREISEQQQVRVLFSHTGLSLSTPPDIALCVFRVVQEALRNTVKHSGAREATVELVGDHDRVFLRVSDGGAGFDTAERYAGLGLVSMRERVRYAGGVLDITSHTGQGTRIEVELPLRAAEHTGARAS